MNCFRYGSLGSALLEACSMTFGYSFDMPLRGRNRCLKNSEKVADFVQTLKKIRGGSCHLYEPFATPQERLCFDHCETNCRVESSHFHVRKRCRLSLKRLHVAGELMHSSGRIFILLMFQCWPLALRPYQFIERRSRVRRTHDMSRLRFIDYLITSRNLAIDVSQLRYEACQATMEHTCLAFDLSHHVLRCDDFEGSFHHRVDLVTAMRPEGNRDGGQGCSKSCKRANPFTLCAKRGWLRPLFPQKHRDARHYARDSCSSKEHFRTGGFGHVGSVRVERESYSIGKEVSA